jgi:hypothetical protein
MLSAAHREYYYILKISPVGLYFRLSGQTIYIINEIHFLRQAKKKFEEERE